METDSNSYRRSYRRLITLAVVLSLALVPLSGLGAAQQAGTQSYVAVQDGECTPITSFTGNESATEFYDYRLPAEFADNPYINTTGSAFGSEGTIDLQEPDTSIVFLYTDTSDDSTNLVFVNGAEANNDSDGGAATFEITNLPEDGEWEVRDDDYNGSSNEDIWTVNNTTTTVDWLWGDAATDGGVHSGISSDTNVTIDPAFNEDAELSNQTNGTVEEWQVLSNDSDNVTRTDLDLNETVQISAGTCEDVDGDATDTGDETDNETDGANETATVEFEDQETEGTTVTVDNVTVPRDGYVAIHNESLLDGDAVGSVVGVSDYLEAGQYDDLSVELFDVPGADFNESELTENQTLIAMPHEETTDDESYDFVSSNGTDDGPYTDDGEAVTDAAEITVVNETDDNETDDTVTDTPADNETDTPADNETDTPEDNETEEDDSVTPLVPQPGDDTPEDDGTDTPEDDGTDTPEDDTPEDDEADTPEDNETPEDDEADTPEDDTPEDDGNESNGPLVPGVG